MERVRVLVQEADRRFDRQVAVDVAEGLPAQQAEAELLSVLAYELVAVGALHRSVTGLELTEVVWQLYCEPAWILGFDANKLRVQEAVQSRQPLSLFIQEEQGRLVFELAGAGGKIKFSHIFL